MQYFYNEKKVKTAAHIWNSNDTYCRMLSTGGMKLNGRKVQDTHGHKRICQMCVTNYKKFAIDSSFLDNNLLLD